MLAGYAEYVEPKILYFSDDESNQVITEFPNTCTNWKCQKWECNIPIAPILIKNENGFWCCPICKCSYGKKGI